MLASKFLDPRNDLSFKRIFGTEKNKDILIHFLNDIFDYQDTPIESITFLSSSQIPEVAAQRVSIVDVMCQDTGGNRFIVEIQVVHEPGFAKRAQYYAAKAYIEQRGKGNDYKDLKKVTFLAITDFTLFPHKKEYLSHHQILDTKSYEHDLKDFSFSFLELPKFTKTKDQLTTLVDKWAYYFKYADETHEDDLQQIIGTDIIIKRAYDELNRFNWSQEELRTYDSVDMKRWSEESMLKGAYKQGEDHGLEKGRAKGESIGLQKGKLQGMRMIVNTMRTQQLDEAQISVLTGLTIEEIKLLQS